MKKMKIGHYQDILQQIGGNKFLAMTGSKVKYYGYDESGYAYLRLKLSRNKSGAELCFNPCFNGTTSATFKNFPGMYYTSIVSILVLTELPLQQFFA